MKNDPLLEEAKRIRSQFIKDLGYCEWTLQEILEQLKTKK